VSSSKTSASTQSSQIVCAGGETRCYVLLRMTLNLDKESDSPVSFPVQLKFLRGVQNMAPFPHVGQLRAFQAFVGPCLRQVQMNLDRHFPFPREFVRTVQLFRAQVLRHSPDTGEVITPIKPRYKTRRTRQMFTERNLQSSVFIKSVQPMGSHTLPPVAPTLNVEEHATAEAVPTSS